MQKNGRVVVNLSVGRQEYGKMCDRSGHGFAVYYNGEESFVKDFLRGTCIWGGSSNTYKVRNEDYRYYEFSYENYDLFLQKAIHIMFERHDVELKILYTSEDVNKFWFEKED